ncbi:ftsH [Symbiodinium natans]|uniref:FtsH protein n=1 Tax=Symbiodinium natans TaxID=878477 RepID=A0A812V9U8_9DINO|nr:ftsH [Symbiodinium natans]
MATLVPRVHLLQAQGQGCPGLRFLEPEAFVEELTRLSFAIVCCPKEVAQPVACAMQRAEALLSIPAATGLCLNYKRQKDLKQRLQVRRTGQDLQASAEDDPRVLASSFEVMEAVAQASMEAWCDSQGVPTQAAKSHFGDLSFGEEAYPEQGQQGQESAIGKGKSVLNLYHYFNQDPSEEPCRQHADPGLVTVLCLSSTKKGLEVRLPLRPGGAPGKSATYDEEWQDVEAAMDSALSTKRTARAEPESERSGRSGRSGQDEFCFLVIAGETLERLSAGQHPACLHRVAHISEPRFNMAFELRPRCNVWHPWQQLEKAP